MKIYFNSILKNKNLIKYLLIGILNTIFAYISGVVFFYLFYKDIGVLLLTLLTTIINIFFTFINYKFFYFKTHKKYFIKELLKINLSYISIFLLNVVLLWFLTEKFNLSIYFTQAIIILINIIISIKLNFSYVFKNK
jgi:putative flippase GtrA